MNFQYINSNKFLTGDQKATNFLDNYNSKYLYSRVGYGVTKDFTMSIEAGYFFNKTQIGLNKRDTISGSGFGDLIIFPRYNIFERNTDYTRTEVTVGLGYKIPIGKHLDSTVVYTDPTGKEFFTPKPPAVMPTTGSQDVVFYSFVYRGYPMKDIRFFANLLYIKKGWNELGQRFGDYASVGLFAGKTFRDKLGVTLQLRGEWIDVMKHDKQIDMLALYNLDVNSTGGRWLIFAPQLSYTYKGLTGFVISEFPLYQYINGTAIASQHLYSVGFSYRFFTYKSHDE